MAKKAKKVTKPKKKAKKRRVIEFHPGCWAEFREHHTAPGNAFRLQGPIVIRKTDGIQFGNTKGKGWKDEISSLTVGPNARVEVWESEDYGGQKLDFGPGSTSNSLAGLENQIETIAVHFA